MAKDKPADHVRILMARHGWGRSQAEAYAAQLTPEECAAIAKVKLAPEHAAVARLVFDAVADALYKRQAADAQRKAAAAKRK